MIDRIEWTKDLETGIPFIDADHKTLVSLVNQTLETIGDPEEQATLGSILNALVEYTEYHFAREERLMELTGYEKFQAHHRLHEHLTDKVYSVRSRYEGDPTSIQGAEVGEFLKSWLQDHILGEDMRYKDVCAAHPELWNEAAAVAFDAVGDDYEDPFAEPDEDQAPEAMPDTSHVDWSSLSVLVVDDNRNFQVMLNTLLKVLGVETVRYAGSAEEGAAMLKEQPADLLLTDWLLGGKNGIEFVADLRAAGVTAKILMVTGYGDSEVRQKALDAGVDAFLEKPITARGFLEATAKLYG